MSIPVTAAHAATTPRDLCQVIADRPYVDDQGMVRGAAARKGCDDPARLRVRLMQARPGPDRALKSGSKVITNGQLVAGLRCTTTPRTFYVTAVDSSGETSRSRPARLSCSTKPTPTPTPTTPTPTPTGSPTATPTPTPTATQPGGGVGSAVEEEVVRLTNAERTAGGCKPLTHDPKLNAAARGHSNDMAAKNYFSHTSQDGRSPGDRIKAAGFSPISTWGENIAKGQPTAASVVKGWMNSPGHKANIMNCNFTLIGVGHDAKGPIWTQVFARH
ncbi:CAP domain-containing protein [Nonomuraea typhae]|uniref:CAP domain-containing protein n=1 Tax=Nonomuraea typhae TaxID=2603600 RepID=UPI001CA50A86|nr:CAP domain-containing protein [Nonomuraea typhae]